MAKRRSTSPSPASSGKGNSIFQKLYLLTLLLFNLLILFPLVYCISLYLYQLHFCKPNFPGPYTLTIKKNQSLSSVAKELEQSKIITSHKIFLKWLEVYGFDRSIKAGKFRIKSPVSLWKLMNILTGTQLEKITLPEGLSLEQTAKQFESIGLDSKQFIELCKNPHFIKELGIHQNSLEGYLFPDTYRIAYGEDEKRVIKLLIKRFNMIVEELNIRESVIYRTTGIKQGLTLASLVEKESHYLPERPTIASVFWNRLKNNWRLDSDVTVHYALKKWTRTLTKEDLGLDSPYNTRKYKGLPPTPICSPSKSSLKAAFFPAKSKYMFFVASGEKSGQCIFSKTLKQHNKIVKKLRKEGKI